MERRKGEKKKRKKEGSDFASVSHVQEEIHWAWLITVCPYNGKMRRLGKIPKV